MQATPGPPPQPSPPVDAPVVVKRRPGHSGRLLVEADRLSTLAGPGVVPLQRIALDDAGVELHLDAASGSVADLLAERGRLDEPETRAVGVATAGALLRLHGAGVIHGDIKPANLLLSADGELWLADLEPAFSSGGRTMARGTPGRHRADAAATPAVDVVALAVMLVELATGVVPDPSARWTRRDLIGLDCPPELATDLSSVLSSLDPPRLADFSERLNRGDHLELPAPAKMMRGVDPTPTLDFDPVVAAPVVRPGPSHGPDELASLLVILLVLVVVVVAALAVL